jgi:hypothetical protein
MNHKIVLQTSLFLGALAGFSDYALATGFMSSTEKLSCGKVSYVIESTCKKATDHGLNTCKPQTLRIHDAQRDEVVKLPHLTSAAAKQYEKSGGELEELFVIAWGCANADGHAYLTLHYSVGGGSGPTSEAYTTYDEAGKLLGKGMTPQSAHKQFSDVKKPVRSIMSD